MLRLAVAASIRVALYVVQFVAFCASRDGKLSPKHIGYANLTFKEDVKTVLFKTHVLPRSKHFSSRLHKPIS
jgi:hypothetical protein